MGAKNEASRIAMLARVLASPEARGVIAGIGDDAAVLDGRIGDRQLVWTIDEQVEGTHFRRDFLSWHDVGYRSFTAAASDLAAMGATPWCALCALVLPDDVGDQALEEIARGQREAAASVGAPVVGGNLARGPALSVATTLLGTCTNAVLRKGAIAGDGLWLAGRVGLAAAGLRALERGLAEDSRLGDAVAAWRAPTALVASGQAMAAVAHASVDVSDGLARDAGHIGEASGVRIVLDEDALCTDSGLVAAASVLGDEAQDLALHGGEDYALVVASPVPIDGFRRIGSVEKGTGVAVTGRGGQRTIGPGGYDHFVRRAAKTTS